MPEKGKFITCQNCGFKFKWSSDQERSDWKEIFYTCPACKELYCNKPKIERQLFLLQKQYFDSDRDEKSFTILIKLMLKYSESLIKKFFTNSLHDGEDVIYYSHNAISFLVEEYLKNKDYQVWGSFGGAIIGKIKQSIYCKENKASAHESLNEELEDGKELSVYMSDNTDSIVDKIEEEENKQNIFKYVRNIITQIGKNCTKLEDYMRILAIRHYLLEGENKADKLFQEEIRDKDNKIVCHKTYGRFGKYKYLKTLDIIKKELIKLV